MSYVYIPTNHLEMLLSGKGLLRRELRTFIALWQCLSELKEIRPIPERSLRKALRIRLQPTELRRAVNKLKRIGAVPDALVVEWEQ